MGVVVRRAEPGDQRGLTTLVGKAGGPSMVRSFAAHFWQHLSNEQGLYVR